MKTVIAGVTYHYEWLFPYQSNQPTLVCLHGFTGSGKTFQPVFKKPTDYNLLTIDLIGHGQTESDVAPERYTMACLQEDLILLTERIGLQRFSLLGYSMGARVALGLAIRFPEKIDSLFLESGSPGLASRKERQARIMKDHQLAEMLLSQPLEKFVDKWEKLPLFASQTKLSPAIRQNLREERLKQNPFGLASSLWYMGTGAQTSYWEQLNELAEIPTLLLVGDLDTKFVKIAEAMKAKQPKMQIAYFENVGHCVHLEQPTHFVEKINQWMQGG